VKRWATLLVGSTLILLFAVPAVRHWREQPPPPPPQAQPLRSTWLPDHAVEVGAGSDYPFGLALAPDGRHLAFPAARAGGVGLWLENLSSGELRALSGTSGAATPFWSPDGSRIGFLADGRFKAIDPATGSVSDLAAAPAGRGGSWNEAGDLVFVADPSAGLMRRRPDGMLAALTAVNASAGETAHSWPVFLPGGTHVAFLVSAASRLRAGVWIAAVDTPAERRRLVAAEAQPIVAGRTVLYLNDLVLMAQPLDPAAWSEDGRPFAVGLRAGRGPLGQVFATASADVLIYGAPGSTERELRWVGRDGTPRGRAGDPADAWDLRIAPDGRRIAVTELDPQLRTLDVWIREPSQPAPVRLSLGMDVDESGVWSPDGGRVAWAAARRTIMIRGAGAVLPEQEVARFEPPVQVWDWSPDGHFLLTGRTHPQTRDDLWIVPASGAGDARPYAAAGFNQTHGVFSPDGAWMAYASDESGQFDIYIDTYPEPGARIRVTTAGGTEPRWRRDGRELYFRRGTAIHAVSLGPMRRAAGAAPAALDVHATDRLFDAGAAIRAYDAAPDGRRFLLNLPAATTAPRSATMVMNWSGAAPQ
jgi:Tol biopolymer transport system component